VIGGRPLVHLEEKVSAVSKNVTVKKKSLCEKLLNVAKHCSEEALVDFLDSLLNPSPYSVTKVSTLRIKSIPSESELYAFVRSSIGPPPPHHSK
jgi:hypothetical protein